MDAAFVGIAARGALAEANAREPEPPAQADTGCFLFVPVSGGSGSGELQRARLLARAIKARFPRRAVAIIAERGALADLDDPGVLRLPLPGSPTRNSSEVCAAIARLRPAVVIFDSTARSQQLRAARHAGARVVFLSSRPSARARGFRIGALRSLDEHWSVELGRAGTIPNRWQRWLASFFPRVLWRPLGVLFEEPQPEQLSKDLADWIAHGPYALFCPGGGGGTVDGLSATEGFAQAARTFVKTTDARALVVHGDWSRDRRVVTPGMIEVGLQGNGELMNLMINARFVVIGAGSLLLQALALGVPSIATALARDQPARLQALAQTLAVMAPDPTREDLSEYACALWTDPAVQLELVAHARLLGLRNGLNHALDVLASMAGETS